MAIQKGTGFTNLNRIMQANKGNKLGSTVSGGIQGQVQGVQSGVKSAQEQFQEEAQKNRLDTQASADKRSEILGRFAPSTGTSAVQSAQVPGTTAQGAGTTEPPAAQSPVSDQEITDFTKFRTGTYTGPKELKDSQSLYGKAQQAEELGGLSRSEGGRQELLRRFVGGKNYTTGQRQLDSTLLGEKPGQLGSASRQARGAMDTVNNANSQASNLAQEYANRAKSFGEETVKKLGETKDPLSQDLERRVGEAKTSEDKRVADLNRIQSVLAGSDPQFKGLDQWTRTGLALQDASDKGYLQEADLGMLLGKDGKIGLLQRGANLGLDVNKLLNERITNTQAQNIARTGVAGDEDVAKLNALDRLAGKQGTDLEFLSGRGKYAAGKTGFNTSSLEDYISKTEAEKARSDSAYADKLAAEQARYMNQAMAGGMQAIGGQMDLAGAGLNQVINPESYLNPGTGLGNVSTGITGAANSAAGFANLNNQGGNALMEGLLKLNVGGKSIADTEGGRQLLKAIELKSKLGNTATGNFTNAAGNLAQGVTDLGSTGSWDDALMNLSGGSTVQDIARQLSGGDVGKSVKNVGKAAKSIGKSIGGAAKKAKKKLKKVFSDENLKTEIEYNSDDVQKFMDRLKPAAYDYKDEVKDSPLASKNRELGVMAQDLEKSELGKDSVEDTEMGKVVDYDNLQPKMLASIAALNRRLKEVEGNK